MRVNFLTLFLLLIVVTANCQLTLSVQAGSNLTTAHVVQTNNYGDYKIRAGWQAALNIKYSFATHWFGYSGAGVDKKSIFNQKTNYDNQYISYKPLFVTLPIGIGYSLAETKNLSLNFYTGLYGSIGLGGKYLMRQASWMSQPNLCDLVACPESFDEINRHIHFGNSSASGNDLRRANWGAQFGVGLSAWRRFEIACMYNWGLSNILPSDTPGEKLYLRSLNIDVKMNIKTFKQPNKNK